VEDVGLTPEADRFWRDRPTLVTGGTGLLGGWLVRRLLAGGAEVVCLVHERISESELVRSGLIEHVQVVHGDVLDRPLLERALSDFAIDTVMHLAAQTIVGVANRSPISTFDVNIRGTWNLLEACRAAPAVKQIVIASSDKAYAERAALPFDEDSPLRGLHPYDASKSCADLIAQCYATTYSLPVAITRCGNFFGGGDLNWDRIVPGTIRSIIRGERPEIRSDGKSARDFLYVEDGAAAYTLLAERLASQPELRGEAFNFSNATEVTVIEVVRQILVMMGSTLEPDVHGNACNEIRRQYLSTAKAQRVLAWQPQFTLEEGLRRTIDWYRHFLARPVPAGEPSLEPDSA
jgi:CDP-glucose 4,6-dehydratase